ncbi:hypothetical protein [Rhodococcus rhodochrous]|uniref:hypothetical protein n=1 Tax=Rhodococcus rhodochrous TaxID=1829 RepID=UPI001E5B1825|nr:hypothetical protein [Rhodococcus rhodochrous]MCD2100062.1 hypothetical protein [Rhodococcus rhodochrous]MCD2124482.1 hypothetical protein [Rhodococcus rhodochrous]MCQ4137389.1 hypothetical protein [Rhodococcus rhodochrous]MDJ0021237.1 hypothetical protein [Rhodococcus rhodochrous]
MTHAKPRTPNRLFRAAVRLQRSQAPALLAMVPGFVLPFAISLASSPDEADTVLLGLAISVTLINVVVNSVELNAIGEYGRYLSSRGIEQASARDLASAQRDAFIYAVRIGIPIGVGLSIVYVLGRPDPGLFLICAGAAVLVAIAGGASASCSAYLIATGKSATAIATQSFRSVFALVSLAGVSTLGVWVIAVAMPIGEIVRFFVLRRTIRKSMAVPEPEKSSNFRLNMQGMGWQSASTAASQISPVVDRAFLGNADSGSIAAYEMADKVLFAVIQFLNLSFLVRMVGNWSRLWSLDFQQAQRLVRSDIRRLIIRSMLSAAAAAAFIAAALYSNMVPDAWHEGLLWGLALLASVPFGLITSSYARLLIIIEKQNLLLRFSIITILVNLIADLVLYTFFGAIGIVLASGLMRVFSSTAYSAYFRFFGWAELRNKLESGESIAR